MGSVLMDIPTFSVSIVYQSDFLKHNPTIGGETSNQFQGEECDGHLVFGVMKAGKDNPIEISLDLPPHYYLVVALDLWFLDSWETGEYAVAQLDDQEIDTLSHEMKDGQGHFCGRGKWKDGKYRITNEFEHHQQSSKLKITAHSNQTPANESVGVSNISIRGYRCNVACSDCSGPGNDACLSCARGYRMYKGSCIPMDYRLFHFAQSASDFNATDSEWGINNSQGMITCSGQPVLSSNGTDVDLVGRFNGYTNHVCALQMDTWFMDTWDEASVLMIIDNQQVHTEEIDLFEEIENGCGNRNATKVRLFSEPVPIKNPRFEVYVIVSQMPSSAHGSFGVSNIKMYCTDCHHSCRSCARPADENYCSGCPGGMLAHATNYDVHYGKCLPMTDGPNPCANDYLYHGASNTCYPAHLFVENEAVDTDIDATDFFDDSSQAETLYEKHNDEKFSPSSPLKSFLLKSQ